MSRIRSALEQADRLRALPALARDMGASVAVLAAFAGAAALPLIAVPAAVLVLLPVLLLTAVAFGRDSALLAALLAALMARHLPLGPSEGSPIGLLPVAVLSGAALAVAALLEELRRSRADAETAHHHLDTVARLAAERVEAARRQLRDAEERLVEAESRARGVAAQERRAAVQAAAARTSSPDPALDSAFRSEGGI